MEWIKRHTFLWRLSKHEIRILTVTGIFNESMIIFLFVKWQHVWIQSLWVKRNRASAINISKWEVTIKTRRNLNKHDNTIHDFNYCISGQWINTFWLIRFQQHCGLRLKMDFYSTVLSGTKSQHLVLFFLKKWPKYPSKHFNPNLFSHGVAIISPDLSCFKKIFKCSAHDMATETKETRI